ncbi:MAG: isochorismatase family protein [Sphingomonas sp.]
MPLTTLDPNTALIVVDLQKGLVGAMPAETFDPVVARSRALADAFRAGGLPVVLVTVDGIAPGRTEHAARLPSDLPAGFADVLPELARQPGDILVTKRTWGVFASTDLERQLRGLGVTQVVVTGVATGAGVESTARQAYEAGFNVTLAVDAMTDSRAEAHAFCVASVFPRLGETGTTEDILHLLEGRA